MEALLGPYALARRQLEAGEAPRGGDSAARTQLADRVEAVLAERTDLAAMIAPLLAGAEAVAAQIKRLRQRGRRAGKGDAGGRPADYHPRRRPI